MNNLFTPHFWYRGSETSKQRRVEMCPPRAGRQASSTWLEWIIPSPRPSPKGRGNNKAAASAFQPVLGCRSGRGKGPLVPWEG